MHISAKSRHGAACTMKKVIVVGMMKNHEENVVNPIIDALKYLKADVERVGGISDFFEPQSKVKYLKITRRQRSLFRRLLSSILILPCSLLIFGTIQLLF